MGAFLIGGNAMPRFSGKINKLLMGLQINHHKIYLLNKRQVWSEKKLRRFTEYRLISDGKTAFTTWKEIDLLKYLASEYKGE